MHMVIDYHLEAHALAASGTEAPLVTPNGINFSFSFL